MANDFPSKKGQATINDRLYVGYERKVAFLVPEDARDLEEGLAIEAIASQTFWVHGYPCKMIVLD